MHRVYPGGISVKNDAIEEEYPEQKKLKPRVGVLVISTLKGVLNPNFRPLSIGIKQKIDFLK